MTRDELRTLIAEQPTVPFLTALEAIGVSETKGRKAHAAGALPFRVLTIGRWRVPSCDLEALLLTPNSSEDPAPTGSVATTVEAVEEPRHDQCAPAPALRSVSR
jgi:hypothetical protein